MTARIEIIASELVDLYWGLKLSTYQIASKINISETTVIKRMREFGIPRRSVGESIRLVRIGEQNPMWRGDNVNPGSGRDRAQRMYPQEPCCICGERGERHHKDGNTLNNKQENIGWLCRRHHMEADGRMARLRNNPIGRAKR